MSFLSGNSMRTGCLRGLVHGLAFVGALAILGMMLVTVADVLGRQFGLPVKGAYDIVRALGAVAMVCALPITKAVKGHIAIEYFFQKMARRGRVVTDTLMRLLLLVFFVLLTVEFARQGQLFRESGEVTVTLHMPIFWVFWLAAFACALTTGVTLWHVLHPGHSMMRPRE
ncbi:MAG: TRAP transporter small permease subunit [Verrucomicrobiota bacterium]|jgi:TRAP-type C4-dicarboxylate transport system permease small subunit|nr:TRAP transporter small permease subunit [Verrucomicrobiota bacterium]